MKDARYLNEPLPEIYTRLAGIRTEDGKTEEAIDLYRKAKDFLAQRIRYDAFFGDLNIMMWLIDNLYELMEFDKEHFDFFDMYYLLTKPCRIGFYYNRKHYEINAEEEKGEFSICFLGKFYRNREDFYKKACIGSNKLTSIYDELYGFEAE